MIEGDRVRQAREFKGLTQTELGRRIGVNQSTVAYIESGSRQPSPDVLTSLSVQTGFPPAFFRQGPPPQFPLGSLLFRSLRETSGRDRAQAQRYGEILWEAATRMARSLVTTSTLRIPRLAAGASPNDAANVARRSFGIDADKPVGQLVNLLERSGAIVLALPTSLPKRDAFSTWTDTSPPTPLIVLSSGVPGDRLRYSVAHELAHLVLHAAGRSAVRVVEAEANRFASAFLMPEAAIREEMAVPVTLTGLAELKRRWGVSIQALAVRGRGLNILSDRQYRDIFRQIGARGWRLSEPVELPVEKPRAFRKMAEVLYGTPIDVRRLATDTALPVWLLEQTIEAHASREDMPRRGPKAGGKVVHLRLETGTG